MGKDVTHAFVGWCEHGVAYYSSLDMPGQHHYDGEIVDIIRHGGSVKRLLLDEAQSTRLNMCGVPTCRARPR